MENELTVNNFCDKLSEFKDLEFDNNVQKNAFRVSTIKKIYMSLTEYFYGDFTIAHIEHDLSVPMGSSVYINDNETMKWIDKPIEICFRSLYPNILSKLLKNGEIKINITELGYLYTFIVDNNEEIRRKIKVDGEGKTDLIFKYILNSFYGILVNQFIGIYIDDLSKIVKYTESLKKHISDNYEHFIYSDIDTFYVKEVNSKLIEALDKVGLEYDISNGIKGYFIAKQKYVFISEDGNNTIKGIQLFNKRKNTYNTRYKHIYDAIKVIERNFKIDKLISKI